MTRATKSVKSYWAIKQKVRRERLRAQGFVMKQYWIHGDDEPAVDGFVRSLKRKPECCP